MMYDLRCGDCLDLMWDIPDGSIDAIICDLPYGVTRNKWDSVLPFPMLWANYNRIISDRGVVVLFGSGMFTALCMCSNPLMWRYNLVWEKTEPTGFLNANKMPLRSHEDIMIFYKKLPTYNPQKTKGHIKKVSSAAHKANCKKSSNYGDHKLQSYESTERFPKSVILCKTDKQKQALHPTQKPVALLEYLIRTYTNEGDTVLDNCMGSGSTGVACVNTGRNFIGIELDRNYFDIATKRITDAENKNERVMCDV
jgi:site-specific DNA-methyltransferase (adenine-specific)